MKLMKNLKSKFKKFVLAGALIAGLTSSCNLFNDFSKWYEIDDSQIPVEVDTPKEIHDWVHDDKNIRYKKDSGRCATAQETLDLGYGDCDRRSVLELALYYKRCNEKGSLLYGYAEGEEFYI